MADCRVNGAETLSGGYEMRANFAAATAGACVVKAQSSTVAVAGATNSFKLSISDANKLAMQFDGSEGVTAFVSGVGSAAAMNILSRQCHLLATAPLHSGAALSTLYNNALLRRLISH